jgi:SAM-dependent methyltransferase
LPHEASSTDPPRRNWFQRLLERSASVVEPCAGAFELIGPYYDQLMSSVPYQDWVDYIERLLRRFDVHPRRVLDLACGTGKVGAELAHRGYAALGVDVSEGMVRIAAREGRLPAAVQDARALGIRAGAFDLVVSLYDSLNYILQPKGLLATFRGVRHALRPDGWFIFDLNTIRALALELFTQDNLRSDDALLYSWRSHWDARARVCTVDMWFRWRGEGADREFREVHRQRGYEDAEVKHLVREAGMEVRAVFEAYGFEPLTPYSTRAFYIVHR